MIKRDFWIFLSVSFIFSGCLVKQSFVSLTSLEIQRLQTREYKNKQKVVFSSVLSVFQDLGYIIKNADRSTGLIIAKGIASSSISAKLFLGKTRVSQMNVTAFVEKIGCITKLRLNFVRTLTSSSVYGQTDQQDQSILDAELYNSVFEHIKTAIFIRSNV